MATNDLELKLKSLDDGFTKGFARAVKAVERLEKSVAQAESKTATSATKIKTNTKKMATAFEQMGVRARKGLSMIKNSLFSLSGLIIGGGIIVGMSKMVKAAKGMEKGLAEVGTLLDGDIVPQLKEYRKALLAMEQTSSKTIQDLTKGLYQTISAGVTDATQAVELLNTAQKAAVGGLTDVSVAVDALTTVTNAWKLSTQETTEASDILFTIVKRGKTVFPAVSANIGKVATIASQAGVSLAEVGASIATLTKAGLSTELATTALRQLFANIIKPSEEAKKKFNELGISYGQAALKGGAFVETMRKIHERTGGSVDDIVELIPNIRALQAALVLAGSQITTFEEDLVAMENAAGATDRAFGIMAETADEKLAIQMQRLAAVMRDIGVVLLPLIVKWLTSFADVISKDGNGMVLFFKNLAAAIDAVGSVISSVLDMLPHAMDRMDKAAKLAVDTLGPAFKEKQDIEKARADVILSEGVGGLKGATRFLRGKTGLSRDESLKLAQSEVDRLEREANWEKGTGAEPIIRSEIVAIEKLIQTVKNLKAAEEEADRYRRAIAILKAKEQAAAEEQKALEKAEKTAKRQHDNLMKMLEREEAKRKDGFEKLDDWYMEWYDEAKKTTDGLARLDEIYFDKLEVLVNKKIELEEKAAEKILKAWAKMRKEEEAIDKATPGIGTSTPSEQRGYAAMDALDKAKTERKALAERRGRMVGETAIGATGSVGQSVASGAQTGGVIGGLIGLISDLGFKESMSKEEAAAARKDLKSEYETRGEELKASGATSEQFAKLEEWYNTEKTALSDRVNEFENDWTRRTQAMGRVGKNLLHHLTTMIRVTLGELPGTIMQALGDIDLADLIINGVFEGIKKFFTGSGKAIKKFFKGGKKSGFATLATFGISRLFHKGGVVGSNEGGAKVLHIADALARRLEVAHDGKQIGLKPNEVPAILEKGELVMTEEQQQAVAQKLAGADRMAAGSGGGDVYINVGIATTDEVDRWADARVSKAMSKGTRTGIALGKRTGRTPGLTTRRR